jgi:hypothetical protein
MKLRRVGFLGMLVLRFGGAPRGDAEYGPDPMLYAKAIRGTCRTAGNAQAIKLDRVSPIKLDSLLPRSFTPLVGLPGSGCESTNGGCRRRLLPERLILPALSGEDDDAAQQPGLAGPAVHQDGIAGRR